MTNFLKTGIYTEGCIIPVTTEDPELIVLEAIPTANKPRWGILFFLGEPKAENCIGLINNETDFSLLHKSILSAPVVKRDGKLIGSVAKRINNQFNSCII